jgi:dimeric dUTPase (all-alpha-NTP-PPase superfamily)
LTWSYIYSGEYIEAIRSISELNNRKEKRLIRLLLKEITSLGTKDKLSKKEIDKIVLDKKDIIKRTRANLIVMSKHEIIDYGP